VTVAADTDTPSDDMPTARWDAVAPLRRCTLVPGQAPELWITPNNDSLSITCGHKQYLLPAEDVTVLPLVNTHTALLDQWILSIGLSCGLPTVG
jgi:hypothetical protein